MSMAGCPFGLNQGGPTDRIYRSETKAVTLGQLRLGGAPPWR